MSSTGDVSYQSASPGDLVPIKALLAQAGLPTEDLSARHLAHFIVGRFGDRIVATAGLELLGGGAALFRSLAVAPDCRGRRFAHELWNRAQTRARERGVRELYLLTTTAEALFAGWGFRAVARDVVPEAVRRTSEFSTTCPSSAIVMVMDLAAKVDGSPLR